MPSALYDGRNKMIKEKAYAKVNLYLEVLDKLPSGYHNIDTVMQTVTLCDEVTLNCEKGESIEIVITCDNGEVPCDSRNTAYKAAELFLEEIKENARVEIDIEKKIPMCAGLGGGSADAAAVLRGLNKMYGNRLTLEELCDIGLRVGADVPFCIKGGATLCGGIGEIFTPCASLSDDCLILIAIGKQGSPTPQAYQRLDNIKNRSRHIGSGKITEALENGDIRAICANMYNAFEKVVLPINSECSRIRRIMSVSGALGVLMSGSGAAVFGIFSDKGRLEGAKSALSGVAVGVFEAKSVNDI
ncbi:MAG: 4-(cytidine 5'-diphospho)-2-C-methyl-D-erythritol kinase [Ruminococcaceae bacterium]|nr:4-(cytidine 5'-diphospho)-2-C-methyl-D-erythritol kinase [Oscillospiraceae bacterium]